MGVQLKVFFTLDLLFIIFALQTYRVHFNEKHGHFY